MEYTVYQAETPESQHKTKTTISTLPPELLLLIFEFCYEDFQRDEASQPQLADPPWHYISAGLDPSSMRPTSTTELFDRFRSPTRFPFALAAVSPLWNDLLLREQEYWTEIIYTLGSRASNAELIKMMQKFEDYPRDICLDFIVLSERSDWKSDSDIQKTEQNQLHTLIASYLDNHFPYFRSVSIETHGGESFPDIMGGWRYRATNANCILLSSILLAREADYIYRGQRYPRFKCFDQDYDSLNTLWIHGSNLDGVSPSLFNGQISNLEQLVISDYMFSHHSLLFTELLHILANLPHLCRLKLQNILLTYNPGEFPLVTCNVPDLHLESMNSFTITELYRLCDFPNIESLHLTDCVYHEFPFVTELIILEKIKVDPLLTLVFENAIGDWEGSTLWLGSYLGPCNSFLDMLRKYDQWTHEFQCPWMDTLYLYQNPQLSLKRLKKMLKCRNKGVDYSDPDWRTNTSFGPAIKKLSIDQCGVAPLTEKDVEWFSSMLVEFIYIRSLPYIETTPTSPA